MLREAARNIILPRFRHLASTDVERKQSPTDPDDVVTIVDREVESALSRALVEHLPGSVVIGEEATHANPAILNLLHGDAPLWLIDPIDGTRNFVAGDDQFAIMLGYAVAGRTTCGWIFFPARDELFVAEEGSGARFNGRKIVVPPAAAAKVPRGVMHVRYMPAQLKAQALGASGLFRAELDARCAAIEYTDILRGSRDFAVYYRLLPWDHAAPALILTEGGGLSVHLDEQPYALRSNDQVTIVAGHIETAERIRTWFIGDGPAAHSASAAG